MRKNLRTFELTYRIGGDEFFIVLPNTKPDQAYRVAERLRRAVEQARPGDLPVTMSFGVSALGGDSVELHRLMKGADVALYEAKRGGRAKVVLSSRLRVAWLSGEPPSGGSGSRGGGAHREVAARPVDRDGVTLRNVALEDRQGDAVAQFALDDALQGASAEDRVVALLGQETARAARTRRG